jgi:RHS repeat-associated protein
MTITDYYVTTDAMGSVTTILDEDGNVLERRSYDAFGEMTGMTPEGAPVAESPTWVDVGFQGQLRDEVTGLYQMGYRWYLPALGRWLTPDPINLKGGLNSYLFGKNQPCSYVDTFGLAPDMKAMGTLAELFPNQAQKLEKVMKGLAARYNSAERKEANLLLSEALGSAPKELRDKAVESVLTTILSVPDVDFPMPNESPSDYIPKIAAASLFYYCIKIRDKYTDCMVQTPCNPRCEKFRIAFHRCLEISGKAAQLLK